MNEQTTINGNGARPIRATSGAHFACVSLNQWMALTPPELVEAHLGLEPEVMKALRKGKMPVVPA